MLALAYFEAYHTDTSVSVNYLTRAAECFNRVIELGVQKDYLYSNLYTIYYELERYDDAEQALQDYEAAFPDDYMPHALRGMMLITIENNKSQSERNYATAKQEFETAGSMIRSSDDATYYQQLGSLIQQLENEGWL
jgi:tetratricopeptide (TPR) repeat protein